MPAHLYHEALEGYDARQILHDGCQECEFRGKHLDVAFAHMDAHTFARAWQRAHDWQTGTRDVGPINDAEVDLLKALWGVQVNLERVGVGVLGFA
jgi:hypothetical protein